MSDWNRFCGLVRRCIDDYGMLSPGDSVAVGVSGGKDSLVLLAALRQLQRYHPSGFRLQAVTCLLGFEGMDYTPVADWCAAQDIPYTVLDTDIREIVFDLRQESNPCSLCAKLRKGALMNAARELGCSKAALGHHFDDAVETYMMNLLFEGRIGCFQPMTLLDRSGITQIRPLLYCGEKSTAAMAEQLSLPIVQNTCPLDFTSKRREVKELLASMSRDYPDIKDKIFGAMQRLPLDGWAPHHTNRKGDHHE